MNVCRQVAAAILDDPNDSTEVSLIYANQTEGDILVRDLLEGSASASHAFAQSSNYLGVRRRVQSLPAHFPLRRYAKKFPKQFKLWYTLDRPPDGWAYSTGFVSDKMISERLPGPQARKTSFARFPLACCNRLRGSAQDSTIVLMCGPPPMVKFACQASLPIPFKPPLRTLPLPFQPFLSLRPGSQLSHKPTGLPLTPPLPFCAVSKIWTSSVTRSSSRWSFEFRPMVPSHGAVVLISSSNSSSCSV